MTSETISSAKDPGLVPYDNESCARYRAAGIWANRTLPAQLSTAAEESADRTALVTPEGSWTYAQLFEEAGQLARGLASRLGLRAGEPVMFQMGNVAETVTAYLGCLLAGARPVCTLPQHGTREIGLLAQHVGARVLISQADFADGRLRGQARQLLEDGSIDNVILARGNPIPGAHSYNDILRAGAEASSEPLPYLKLDPMQIAVFQLSGGTTGLPKVAPRLHEEYAYNARAWAEAMEYDTESVIFYSLPLMHNAGVSLALQPAILTGATLVLAPSAHVDLFLELVATHRPDVLPLMPPALAYRLLESPRARRSDLSSIKHFVVGGQRLPVETAERLRDDLGISVRQMFGMAEGMFLITPPGASEQVRHYTVGAPISEFDEIRLLEPGTDREVEDGQVGEFVARGPYSIRGYYRAEEHNGGSFTADGFYRSGDLSRRHITAEGVFYSIDGRIKDVINRGVEKIHAEEVEELIIRHPDVASVALVAMPDPVLGEKGCAYLVMEPGREPLTVASLGEYLLEHGVAKYKLPERVETLSAFPLSNVGKISKKELRIDVEHKLAEEGHGAV